MASTARTSIFSILEKLFPTIGDVIQLIFSVKHVSLQVQRQAMKIRLLWEAYRLKSTIIPSATGCYEDRLAAVKHKYFQHGKRAMRIGLPPRGTRSNFLKQTSESKSLGHEKDEPGDACFKVLHLEREDIWTLRGTSQVNKHISSDKGRARTHLGGYERCSGRPQTNQWRVESS